MLILKVGFDEFNFDQQYIGNNYIVGNIKGHLNYDLNFNNCILMSNEVIAATGKLTLTSYIKDNTYVMICGNVNKEAMIQKECENF